MHLPLLLVLAHAFSVALGNTKGAGQTNPAQESASVPKPAMEDMQAAQDPLLMHAMPASNTQTSPRHRQEKVHLMKRMDRKSGKWTTNHPRYRLLEALWAYTRYGECQMAELDRWRSLYKNTSKTQRKVRIGLDVDHHFC